LDVHFEEHGTQWEGGIFHFLLLIRYKAVTHGEEEADTEEDVCSGSVFAKEEDIHFLLEGLGRGKPPPLCYL
jgi:hypothetical protein